MASKLFKKGHCDICDLDKSHLQNLPCLKHHACRSCAAKLACLGPSVPVVDLHTCPICVISAAEDIEPYTEDNDPFEIGFSGDLCNPRTNTPADLVPRQQSPNSQQTFVHVASTRLLNRSLGAQSKLIPTNGDTENENETNNKTPEGVNLYGSLYKNWRPTQDGYNASPPWAAAKSDSLDSVGSWRSSPGGLTQGDITDMGVVALPQRSPICSCTPGAVVATAGTLPPRSLLRQMQLRRDESSASLGFQSESPTPIPLDVNVINPSDTSRIDDDDFASRYLFGKNTVEKKQEESRFVGPPKKKTLRGMAGPIIPGGVQKYNHPKTSVVAKPKNGKDNIFEEVQQKSEQLVNSHSRSATENNSDLSGLNDDIEQLLKDASKPPTRNHGVPTTVILRELPSQKPMKRNAKGQQIPVPMSRYSTLDDNKTSETILRKPSLNMSKLPNSLVTISPTQSKRKPSGQQPSWNQFHDTNESDPDDSSPKKVAFFEERRIHEQPKEAWARRRPFTPFPASGFSSDEDEEEVERCTSPVKRVREAVRRRWDDQRSPSDSEESVDRSSTTTHGYATTHKPNDFWEL